MKTLPTTLSNEIEGSKLHQADAVLLFAHDLDWGTRALDNLRTSSESFLKPVFLCIEKKDSSMQDIADVIVSLDATPQEFNSQMEKLVAISSRVKDLHAIEDSNDEINRKKMLILRYLHTREQAVIQPVQSHFAARGYQYPLLQALFQTNNGDEIEYLNQLEDAKLIEPKLVDRVNLCHNCEHIQINYREVCPQCKSLKITEEASIHHFRCAFVGRESEFKKGFGLHCPKCAHELRHIGVDYDKPANTLWCEDCSHNFLEPQLSCYCLQCSKTFAPDAMSVQNINAYTLTNLGEQAAKDGTMPDLGLIDIFKKELGFYNLEIFKEFLRIELKRCERYKYDSTVALLKPAEFLSQLDIPQMNMSSGMKKNIAEALNATFRHTDIFTETPSGEILVIFAHTSFKNGEIALTRLAEKLSSLFDKEISFKHNLVQVDKTVENIDEILGQLI